MNVRRIRQTNATIINNCIGYSYNTPQAISTAGATFITENYYSVTTAHHKTDIIREFNNPEVIEVKHNTLIDLINQDQDPAAVIQEHQTKEQLKKILSGEPGPDCIQDNQIKAVYTRPTGNRRRDFKNSFRIYTTFKTNFKLVSNFNYKVTNYWKYTTINRNGRKYKYPKQTKEVITF